MTLKFSDTVRNGMLDAVESVISTKPFLNIYTGASPVNVGDAATGTLLFNYELPSDWMNAASGGSKSKAGTWSGSSIGNGSATYFRIYTSGSVSSIQGTVSGSGLGGDMILDNVSIISPQIVTIQTFTLNAGNA